MVPPNTSRPQHEARTLSTPRVWSNPNVVGQATKDQPGRLEHASKEPLASLRGIRMGHAPTPPATGQDLWSTTAFDTLLNRACPESGLGRIGDLQIPLDGVKASAGLRDTLADGGGEFVEL